MAALSPRARRAVTLMFLAVVAIGATAAFYVRPWVSSPKPSAAAAVPTARPVPVQKAGDIVRYGFVSAVLGWAAEAPQPYGDQSGSFAIFKTVDAGRHWRKQLDGHTLVTLTTVFSFRFVDADHGFVVAGDPLVLNRTSDGGEHWTRLALPTAESVGFQFTDASHLWILAGRSTDRQQHPFHLYTSSDAGDTWTQRPDLLADSFVYPLFRDGAEGWSGASDPTAPFVLVTTDGGLTWQRRDLPRDPQLPQPVATAVRLVPGGGVVALVYSPGGGLSPAELHNFTTADGGRSWRAITKASVAGDAGTYVFVDSTHWWSVQDRALYKSDDAGLTWTAAGVMPAGLFIIQVFDARHAWAQLDDGLGIGLAFTSDGGLHWTRTNVPIPQ